MFLSVARLKVRRRRWLDAGCRLVLATVLIAAASLKLSSETGFGISAISCLEYALALSLLVRSPAVNRIALYTVAVFLLGAAALGVWRASGKEGLAAQCGCLGNRIPLATWQQLTLTAVMLVILGVVLLARLDPQEETPQ